MLNERSFLTSAFYLKTSDPISDVKSAHRQKALLLSIRLLSFEVNPAYLCYWYMQLLFIRFAQYCNNVSVIDQFFGFNDSPCSVCGESLKCFCYLYCLMELN